jgi:hypothetical protein
MLQAFFSQVSDFQNYKNIQKIRGEISLIEDIERKIEWIEEKIPSICSKSMKMDHYYVP